MVTDEHSVAALFGGTFSGVASNGIVGNLGIGLLADDEARVSIFGGSFTGGFSGAGQNFGVGVVAVDDAMIDVFGGNFAGTGGPGAFSLAVSDNGVITLHGTGFNLPYGPVQGFAGEITGTLQDGTVVDFSFLRQSPTSEIVLAPPVVPEPSSLALFGVAFAAVAAWRRKGRK